MGDPVRILYIDDDPALVRLAEKQLGRRGYQIIHAEDAQSGQARLDEGPVDAVILDHYLRVGTGLDFLRAMKARHETVPVVYVTGSSEATVAV